MKKVFCLLMIHLISFQGFSQFDYSSDYNLYLGVGGSGYLGDIVTTNLPILNQASLSFSAGISYNISDRFRTRLNFALFNLRGDDKLATNEIYKLRNINFKSSVWEVGLLAEYDLLDKEYYEIIPYVFGGLGVYHFNPYTIDESQSKVFLHDIGTEGQYLEQSGYPQPYKKTQLNIPLGFGIKYGVSEGFDLGLEFNYRILFTDYLDDLSSDKFVDRDLFLNSPYYKSNNIAQTAYDLSYRATNTSSYNIYMPRANPNKNDRYYTYQLSAIFQLGNGGGF
jgi:hypothetical protein